MNPEEILKTVKDGHRKYFQFHFTTLSGEIRGMEEAADLIPKIAKEGISIDGSSIGVVNVNQSDIRIHPDWNTYANYEVDGEPVDRALCTIKYQGKKHPGCLRTLMKDTVAHCQEMGYEPHMFGEVEWYFLYPDRTPHDHAGYCELPPKDKAQRIRHECADMFEKAGCKVKRIHHENGPGQNEVELKLTPAMKNADDLVTAMTIIGAVAAKNGLVADFLPKPLENEAGSGFHQHFALYDVKTGKNVFGAEWKDGVKPDMLLTPIGQYFIGGLLKHADEITAVFARHEQTFKRLVPGHEAPVYACWGVSNRTALVRIPDPSSAQDTRIEYRGGDASGSVHLMCAVMLAAGLDGIENKIPCGDALKENADNMSEEELRAKGIRRLPCSMGECKKVLQTSEWLRKVLGDVIVDYLLSTLKEY